MTKALIFLTFLLSIATGLQAQSDASDINRARIGVRLLSPMLAGLQAEYVLPVVADRIGVSLDISRIPMGGLAKLVADGDDIKANYSYFALGGNFYLSNNGRAKGPYFGLQYQRYAAKTSIQEESNHFEGKATANALGLVFGLKTGGPFLFGFEIGAARPLGGVQGTVVTKENSTYIVESFSKSIPVIPVLNLTIGAAF